MPEIIEAYNSFIVKKEEYCVICLRSKDRRLVAPKNLEEFVGSINRTFKYPPNHKICYICDRQAQLAHQFCAAVELSMVLHKMFRDMAYYKNYRQGISNRLLWKDAPGEAGPDYMERCERRLRAVRARALLRHTEVLQLNTPEHTQQSQVTDQSHDDVYEISDGESTSQESSHVLKSSHFEQSHKELSNSAEHDVLSEPVIYTNRTVILEESDPIGVDKQEDPHDFEEEESPFAETDPLMIIPDPLPPESILPDLPEPTHIPTNPNDIQPSTSKGPKLVPMKRLLQNKPLVDNSLNYLLHPIVQNNGVVTVPSLSAQIIDNHLVMVDKFGVVIKTPKIAVRNGPNIKLLEDPKQITNILSTMNNPTQLEEPVASDTRMINQCSSSNNTINIALSDIMSNIANPKPNKHTNVQDAGIDGMMMNVLHKFKENQQHIHHKKKREDTAVKRRKEEPVEPKETDWEDKIPMDVISFIDAIDPNADKALRTEGPVKPLTLNSNHLGVITDVRSMANPDQPILQFNSLTNEVMFTTPIQRSVQPVQIVPTQCLMTVPTNNKLPVNNQPVINIGPNRVRKSESSGKSVRSWGKSVHIVGYNSKK